MSKLYMIKKSQHIGINTKLRNSSIIIPHYHKQVVLGESTSRLNYFMRSEIYSFCFSILITIDRSKFTVNGETSVHIMRESLFQFSVSYVMQKDSPYTSRWKHLTLRPERGCNPAATICCSGSVRSWTS